MRVVLIVSFLVVLMSCRKDKVEVEPIDPEQCTETISYTNDIQPVLDVNCSTSGCHNANSGSAGYVFETHAQVAEHADIILSVIRHESGFSPMPQGGQKLNDTIIENFECWVDQGKLFN